MSSDASSASTPNASSTENLDTPIRCSITTSDGLCLRAEISAPADPQGLVVLCHPHPLHGGTMFVGAIDHLFHSLVEAGFACLRFNFRGVTGSDGRHEYGQTEPLDVVAGCTGLLQRYPDLPLTTVGWSFGAEMSLAADEPHIAARVAIAPVFSSGPADELVAATSGQPVLLITPEHDQFNSPDAVRSATSTWHTARHETLSGTDHFLHGRLNRLHELVAEAAVRR